jgi:cell division protein FtsB
MRPRRASASNGTVNKRMRLSHETFILGAMALLGLWMVGSLLQELSLNQSLSRQAAALRERNASVQATNDGYRRDIAAISSGAAGEEEARKDGYARKDEKLYIVATPSAPAPAPAPRSRPRTGRGQDNPLQALWGFLTGSPPA